jgi:surface antigen
MDALDPSGPLECVPYARAVSGVAIMGDAWTWWARADGRYARTAVPRAGAVLVFSRTSRLPLGHVSVVTAVIGPREIRVAHANWIPGRVSVDVPVVDVSPTGDWSEVRVFNVEAGAFGRVYRAVGFVLPDLATAGT